MCVCAHSVVSDSLQPHGLQPARLQHPWNSQEYWNGLTFPTPGDLPHPWIEPTSPVLAVRLFTTNATWEAPYMYICPPYSYSFLF